MTTNNMLEQSESVRELTTDEMAGVHGGSFDIENPTTIGSATGGAGAGKIKFNSF